MKTVFVDRDGTIARDVHYCRRVEDFEFLPTVPEAIRLLNEHDFKTVVVTNQSGVARGYFTEATLLQIHQHMKKELARYGAWIDAIYYCPHHPDEGCECRKPRTGLFRQAARELDIDFSGSFVVGDMAMDIEAGRVLSCQTVLVTTGPQERSNIANSPDYIADSLLEAAQWIISKGG